MSPWSGYSIDPAEMESRFCVEDGMAYMDSIFEEPSNEDWDKINDVKQILALIPPREADFVDLYYFKKLRQTDIAEIFGVSQPTVCYRLTRAADRIRFLMYLPPIEKEQMTEDLVGFLSDPLDVRIMILMWETTCQSEVAKKLGVSQGLVRHRFLRSVTRMQDNERFKKYVELFQYVADHLNILREVQRPVWTDNITHCLR